MKRTALLVGLCCVGAHLVALAQPNTLKRDYNWSYTLSATDQVEFLDKYGELIINTTTGKTLTVAVTVETWASNPSAAERLLREVTVRHTNAQGIYSFATSLPEQGTYSRSYGFKVTYRVEVPQATRLRVQEHYGRVYLADFTGPLQLRVKYGQLKADRLTGSALKELELGYSSAQVGMLENGLLDLSYTSGTCEISECKDIRLKMRYSKFNSPTAGKVVVDAAYSTLNFGTIDHLEGTTAYTGFQIRELARSLVLSSRYMSGFTLERLSPSFERVDLEGTYSSFTLGLPSGLRASFENTFSYGDLQGDTPIVYSVREREPTTKYYQGKLGGGGSLIRSNLRYGDLRLRPAN